MKKSKFTEEQIALKQAETGIPVREVIRKMGITRQTFYRCKSSTRCFPSARRMRCASSSTLFP